MWIFTAKCSPLLVGVSEPLEASVLLLLELCGLLLLLGGELLLLIEWNSCWTKYNTNK